MKPALMNDSENLPAAWSRIELLMLDKSIPYATKLAKKVGIKNSITFYLIKKGTQGISIRLAEKFKGAFPELNSGWLITGEGPMYLDPKEAPLQKMVRSIPLYFPYTENRIPVDHIYGNAPVACCADLAVICQTYFHGNRYIPERSVIYLQKTNALLTGSQYVVTRTNEHYIGEVLNEGASALYVLGYDGTQSPLLAVREILDHFRIIGWTVIAK